MHFVTPKQQLQTIEGNWIMDSNIQYHQVQASTTRTLLRNTKHCADFHMLQTQLWQSPCTQKNKVVENTHKFHQELIINKRF